MVLNIKYGSTDLDEWHSLQGSTKRIFAAGAASASADVISRWTPDEGVKLIRINTN